MALQIQVIMVGVTDRGEVFGGMLLTGMVRLRCWAEGADPQADEPGNPSDAPHTESAEAFIDCEPKAPQAMTIDSYDAVTDTLILDFAA